MVYIVAILTVADPVAFNEFESKAISILRQHGGELMTAFEPLPSTNKTEEALAEGEAQQEVHCLRFPNQSAFAAYREDPELLAMAELRMKAISATRVYVSDTIKNYG